MIHVHCSVQFYRLVFNTYKMIGIQTFCLQRLFLLDVTQGRLPGAQMTPIRTGNWIGSTLHGGSGGDSYTLLVLVHCGAGGWGGHVSLAWDIDSITQKSSPTLPCLQVMCHNFRTLDHIEKFISVKGTCRLVGGKYMFISMYRQGSETMCIDLANQRGRDKGCVTHRAWRVTAAFLPPSPPSSPLSLVLVGLGEGRAHKIGLHINFVSLLPVEPSP